jgi:hypothetical protein
VVTVDAKPIKRFEAWLQRDGSQKPLWRVVVGLSSEFFETLALHAVPLDYRAISALWHSALALDDYMWLAHRLCRIDKPNEATWTIPDIVSAKRPTTPAAISAAGQASSRPNAG